SPYTTILRNQQRAWLSFDVCDKIPAESDRISVRVEVDFSKENVMGKIARILIAGVGTLLAAMPLLAHHAFTAEFDAKQQLKLQGKVVRIELINPHTWIHIDVKGDNGELTRWMIEAGTPNTLLRRGLTKATLPIGAEVIVDGFR